MEDGCCALIMASAAAASLYFIVVMHDPPYGEFSTPTVSGCLGWKGVCSVQLPSESSDPEKDETNHFEWKMSGGPSFFQLEALVNPGLDFRLILEATSEEETCKLTGRLVSPPWYRHYDWQTSEANSTREEEQNVTALVEEGTIKLLLSKPLQYEKGRTVGKKKHKRTVYNISFRDEIEFHRREPLPWYTMGLDGQALLALGVLMMYLCQLLVGGAMLLRLAKRMSPSRIEPVEDILAGIDPVEGSDPVMGTYHTQGQSKCGILGRRRQRAEARGYDYHLEYLVIPLIWLVMFLGSCLSMKREHNEWGVLGCPGTDVSYEPDYVALFLQLGLGFQGMLAAVLIILELACSGKSRYLRLATGAQKFEDKMADMQEAKIRLRIRARAWHTVTTSNKVAPGRHTETVTTFDEEQDVEYESSTDISRMIAGDLLRRHPLTCVRVELLWKADSELQAKIDNQRSRLEDVVRGKDKYNSVTLSSELPGFPKNGELGVLNRDVAALRMLTLLSVFLDVFGCGWFMRILREFWTLNINVQIVKELS